jgi:DNA-binding PucR family transcriptional regulator
VEDSLADHRAAQPPSWPWEPPTARVRELLREGAALVLRAPPALLDELDQASLDHVPTKAVSEDPALAAAIRRTIRATLFDWATANVRDPGAPVQPTLGPDSLEVARALVRRGFSHLALAGYRVGQNLAWLRWMELIFGLTSDPSELRAVLDVSSRSISWFIDATLSVIRAQVVAEQEELTRGTHTVRLQVATLVLQGAPVATAHASQQLDYMLDQTHRAAVVWSDEPETDARALERIAEAFAECLGTKDRLTILASASTLWVWVGSKAEPATTQVLAALRYTPGVRISIGSVRRGVDGFRRSHFDALTAQRMLARFGSIDRVVSYDAAGLVSLLVHDVAATKAFIQHTLGDLASADAEVRDALWMFLREGSNTSRTARLLRAHRNTLLRRLTLAEELLPRPLEVNRLQVAVALEMVRWGMR